MTILEKPSIKELIYTIRGQQVMLDTDLAVLYGYEVKRLNEQVKRNKERFPEDFMFQCTESEVPQRLKSQIATLNMSNNQRGLHIKKLPYAFTEQGIYMLSTVLKGELAISQSIVIMRTFKQMRDYLIRKQLSPDINEIIQLSSLIACNTKDIAEIQGKLNQFARKEDFDKVMHYFKDESHHQQFIILEGQRFEADEAYISIIRQAKKSIYLIDNYVNIDTLSLLKHKHPDVSLILFTNNAGKGRGKLYKKEIDDFNLQYPPLTLLPNPVSHDRYFILDYKTDNEIIYHSGASSKDAGHKLCSLNRILDVNLLHPTLESLINQNH